MVEKWQLWKPGDYEMKKNRKSQKAFISGIGAILSDLVQ